MFKLVLLGPPGAGKGTQAVQICKAWELVHISTGDMLREEIKRNSDVGKLASEYLHKGELVPNDLIISMVQQRLAEPDASHGLVLDGFPRTIEQAEALEKLVHIDMAINIAVDSDLLLERICNRRTCIHCKAVFNADDVSGVCTRCGHKLYIRDDDRPETFINRLSVYEARTAPIIEYYRETGKLVTIDGNCSPDEVFKQIMLALAEKIDD